MRLGSTTCVAVLIAFVVLRQKARRDRCCDSTPAEAVFDRGCVEDSYDLGEICASGAQGKVLFATSKSDPDVKVAVKLVQIRAQDCQILTEMEVLQLKREIEITRACDHPNVIKTLQAYMLPEVVQIVMEAASGGEVASALAARTTYTEQDAREVVLQLAQALHYLHTRGIVHRDVKLENVLYSDATQKDVKLVDFGFARTFDVNATEKEFHAFLGTVPFMAPELFVVAEGMKRKVGEMCLAGYDARVDVWAMGVFAFLLMTGELPFKGRFTKDFESAITSGFQGFPADMEEAISAPAREFVEACFVHDPNSRPRTGTLVEQEWLSSPPARPVLVRRATLQARVSRLVDTLESRNKRFRKGVNAVIASGRLARALHSDK